MIRMLLGPLLLGGILMTLSQETAAVDTGPAPVWPSGGTYEIVKVDRAPKLDDFDDALWKQAPPLGPLCASGQPEGAEHDRKTAGVDAAEGL